MTGSRGFPMNSWMLKLAKSIYLATGSHKLREFYWNIFVKLIRDRKKLVAVDGMTFELDLGETIDVCVMLGKYETDIVSAIEQFCKPGWTVLDIGANIGAHCLRFARKVGPHGRVYAFEPTNSAYRKLERNVSLNGLNNVRLFRTALSDRNLPGQEVTIKSSWRTDGRHVVGKSVVDFRKLDDWCAENGVDNVDLIKLDVDGHEHPILTGAEMLLRKANPLLFIEIGAYHFDAPERNPLVFLEGLGYRFRDSRYLGKYTSIDAIKQELLDCDPKGAISVNIIAGHGISC